jgi:hypothetical protein
MLKIGQLFLIVSISYQIMSRDTLDSSMSPSAPPSSNQFGDQQIQYNILDAPYLDSNLLGPVSSIQR